VERGVDTPEEDGMAEDGEGNEKLSRREKLLVGVRIMVPSSSESESEISVIVGVKSGSEAAANGVLRVGQSLTVLPLYSLWGLSEVAEGNKGSEAVLNGEEPAP
jgi:hypothetical protein